MGGSIQRDFVIFLLLSVVIPLLFTIAMLTKWVLDEQSYNEKDILTRHEQVLKNVQFAVSSVKAGMEQISQTREFTDFLLSPKDLRVYSENLLYGRIFNLKKNLGIELKIAIADGNDKIVFGQIEGQSNILGDLTIFEHDIVISYPVSLDDQYQTSGSTAIESRLIATINKKEFIASIPYLSDIVGTSVPGDYTVEYEKPTKANRLVLIVIIFLFSMLLVSVTAGVYMINRFLIRPLRALTYEVESNQVTAKTFELKGSHEIAILRDAFYTFSRNLEEQTRADAILKIAQMFAHDVRTPFEQLRKIIVLLQSDKDTSQSMLVKDLTPKVMASADMINDMISEMLEAGSEVVLNKEITPVLEVLELAMHQCSHASYYDRSKIQITCSEGLVGYLDRLKIIRVISNLLANAFQSMTSEGKIEINAHELNAMLCVEVFNSHSYIPEEEQSLIFQEFFTKRKKGGIGLGLAIARKIVLAHGGEIKCRSTLGHGTIFAFTLGKKDPT